MSSPEGLRGIDVAWLQGRIDWRKVADSGIAFAYIRSGEAAWLEPDLSCQRNLDGAGGAGIVRGIYHVHHTGAGAAMQAKLARLRHHDFRPGVDLPPAIDFEWIGGAACTPADVRACEDFAAAIADAFGVAPVLYSSAGYLGRLVQPTSILASLDLWVAAYGCSAPPVPPPWQTWRIWQWVGNKGPRVPGVDVDCDCDVFHGDRAAFDAWLASTAGVSNHGPAELPRAERIIPDLRDALAPMPEREP